MSIYKTLIFLFLSAQVCLGQAKEDFLQEAALKHAHVGFQFRDISSDQVVLTHQADKLLNPASTVKLFSSLIALEKLGKNHRYKTSCSYTGKINKAGVLHGDIILYGEGDPSFGSERFGTEKGMDHVLQLIADKIEQIGISCIEGKIIVDASFFGNDCTPHSWQFNDLGNYYAAGCWSTNINENAYQISFGRSNKVTTNSVSPMVPHLKIQNDLELGSPSSGDQAYIFCSPYQERAIIRGSIPQGKGLFTIKGAVPNAPAFIAYHLKNRLEKNGIFARGAEVSFDKQVSGKPIWIYKGISLSDQVRAAIHKSINLYCESFLLTLGKGNRNAGIRYIQDYLLKSNTIPSRKAIQLEDGSGLSQRNFVTAESMTKFLVQQHKKEPKLKKYLARSGFDGTLKHAFKSGILKGKVYGKSGSMQGVRAYAGILKTKSAKQLAFCIMVNNYTVPSSKIYRSIDKLLAKVAKQY